MFFFSENIFSSKHFTFNSSNYFMLFILSLKFFIVQVSAYKATHFCTLELDLRIKFWLNIFYYYNKNLQIFLKRKSFKQFSQKFLKLPVKMTPIRDKT